ncbi:MAG: AmmeMemoRadiSam system radical SAM enzyme [Armatimonadota bacterium]|nr:AmmeMemoRadiSam system radical SAM enzyme [Armatimonadota bacterium]
MPDDTVRRAILWEPRDSGRVRCGLCGHRCVIEEGARGICRVRENRGGVLYTLVYGSIVAEHPNPVELKPLHHFHPGTSQHSIATPGCNFRCPWCQNAEISRAPARRRPAGTARTADQIVKAALERHCQAISYTFTEPTIFFEFAKDTAELARAEGLANTFVTNGYMTPGALEMAAGWLDAANVDLKAFSDETYRRYPRARLQPVLDTLSAMVARGIWVEVTTLVIPGVNDQPGELRELAGFIAGELGPEVPWHVNRFHPAHELADRPPTPLQTLERARDIGRDAGLRYVYVGNVPGEQNTHCQTCGELLVRRARFGLVENRVAAGARCPSCGTPVAGVGMSPEG